MFAGAQISLYPMTDRFVTVILGSLSAMDPWRDRLRITTDDVSTTVIGPPEVLFPAVGALFLAAARQGGHVVLNATFSRGCPGEPDDPICIGAGLPVAPGAMTGLAEAALARLQDRPPAGIAVAAQIALYPLGEAQHMDGIWECIDFLKRSGVFATSKHFCTKLRGDADRVLQTIEQAFLGFAGPDRHIVLTAILSAGSPSQAKD
ncbi:MAG: HMP/thiamine-binding protein [Alphaproteobacteria bacterium]|nr:YkoF family thiamine/hydroxymethylpyrimidine-binding protein [Alphaproteobacteria bacterium]TAD87493.1 MAG: HMP/thiamine-binding protein [Alphaproteobacteria bacterium]